MFKVAITGHGSERIRGKENQIQSWIINQLNELKKQNKNLVLLDGMAQGVDQIAAVAAINHKVQVCCYFPYKHKLHPLESYIVDNALEVKYECEQRQKDCYSKRDQHMVDDCDILLVVWDGVEVGGAYLTYKYAKEKGKKIIFFPWKEEEIGLE